MAPQAQPRPDGVVLRALGVAFFVVGLGFVILGAWGISAPFPLTLNTVAAALIGFGFGTVFLVTGATYVVVARSGEELDVSQKGVSVSRDPATGEVEWIAIDTIEAAVVRRWLMSPWIKSPRYAEVELKVREGGLTVEDRFYVHIGRESEPVLARLRQALGPRLEVALKT